MKYSKFLVMTSLLFAQSTFAAFPSACDMYGRVGSILGVSEDQIGSYIKRITAECELSKKFDSVQNNLQNKFGIGLTDISEYQSLRFTQRAWFETGKQLGTPVEKVYQVWAAEYKLPISERKADIWDAWAKGIQQLEPVAAQLANGTSFDLNFLKKVHKGLFPFYPLITEHGDFAHEPNPGVLKPTSDGDYDNYWWSLTEPAAISEAQSVVPTLNANYNAMGLITKVKGYPEYVSSIMNVRTREDQKNPGRQVLALHSTHSMVTRQNTELLLNMVDQLLKQARAGEAAMNWQGRLFTPAELAYFVQQLYVRIHPFYEGNGRTSRFLQELILNLFALPPGSSGDLMDIDALAPDAQYYQIAMNKSNLMLDTMKECAREYANISGKNIRAANQNLISYGCRILSDRSGVWAQLVRQNENSGNYTTERQRLNELDRQNESDHKAILKKR